MAMIFPSGTCHRFTPGHNVHFIQWNLSASGPWEEVTLKARDGMSVLVDIGGHTERWRFHDEDYDRAILDGWAVGQQAVLSAHNLLKIGVGHLYPCRDPKTWKDCRTAADPGATPADPAERITRATNDLGGFFGQI